MLCEFSVKTMKLQASQCDMAVVTMVWLSGESSSSLCLLLEQMVIMEKRMMIM